MNKPLSKNLKTRILLIYNISTFCCLLCWDAYFQVSNQEESIIWFKVTVFYFDACQWSHIPSCSNLRAYTTNIKQPKQRQENMTRGIAPLTPPVQWLEMNTDRCVFCVSKYKLLILDSIKTNKLRCHLETTFRTQREACLFLHFAVS